MLKYKNKNLSISIMEKIPKSKWFQNWGINEKNGKELYQHLIKQKPKVIIETGTFEAQATFVMANAAHQNNNNATIYTIDYDGDPTTNLEIGKWMELKKLRDNNLELIRKKFPQVKVIFLDGDSRQELPKIFTEYQETYCDFFYQDSMHYLEGIKSEWEIVEKYLSHGSYVYFDDLCLSGVKKFRDWFKKKHGKKYQYRESNIGHKQFIVYKP